MAMSKRSKLFISIIVSFIVLAASVTVLLVFLLKDNKKDNPNNPNPPVITDDKYTDANKEIMESAIKNFLNFDENFLANQEPWIREIVEKTLDNIPNSFEKAGVDIKIYSKVVDYINSLKSKLSTIEFDFSEIILEDGTIDLSQIMLALGKMENINQIYTLFSDFYASGITNEDLGRVLYYFIQSEAELIDDYSIYIMMYISDQLPSSELQTLFSGLFIDITTILNDNFSKIPVDDFAVAIGSMLDGLGKVFELYKTLNIYTIVEFFDNLKNGNLSAAEIDTLMTSFKSQIEELIDPETGKFISIPQDAYKIIFSITTKIPALTSLLELAGVPIPEDFEIMDYINPIVNAIPYVEDFVNRTVNGIVNVLGKINNTTKIYRVNDNGEYLESVTLAQAIIDNIDEIVDEETVTINSDTLIIFSKILSGLFESNALSVDFLTSFNNTLRPTLLQIFDLIKLTNPDDTTDYSQAFDMYLTQLRKVVTIINTVATCDLGTSEDKILEISPEMIIIYDQIAMFMDALVKKDIIDLQIILYMFSGIIFAPVFIITAPFIVVFYPVVLGVAGFIGLVGYGTYAMFVLVPIALIKACFPNASFPTDFVDFSEFMEKIFNSEWVTSPFTLYFAFVGSSIEVIADLIGDWFRQLSGWVPVSGEEVVPAP